MSAEEQSTRVPLAVARTVIGVAQGAALYFLYAALEAKTWPATEPLLFAPLVLTVTLVPLMAVAGLGNLRPRTFTIWTVGVAALLVGLAVYDILRGNIGPPGLATVVAVGTIAATETVRNLPSTGLWNAALGGLFIAHSLVVSGDADRKFIASYTRYFDVAWKHGSSP
jgi:drug/metabolite transporter superfamily protein YnfA